MKYLKFNFIIFSLFVLTVSNQTAFGGEKIVFSSFLMTWEVLQDVAWKQWKVQFPIELAKWGERQTPDGSSLLVDTFGDPRMNMKVTSLLNPAHTARIVEISFKNMQGSIVFQVNYRSYGKDLKPYDPNLIRAGLLPFSSYDPGERYMDMKMWILDRFAFRIRTVREADKRNRWVKVKLLSSNDEPFITYSERASLHQRYFRYDFDQSSDSSTSIIKSLMVVKTVLPEEFEGSEEYFLNDQPIDAKTFRTYFDASVTSWVVSGWQKGVASLLTLLQYPDLKPYLVPRS